MLRLKKNRTGSRTHVSLAMAFACSALMAACGGQVHVGDDDGGARRDSGATACGRVVCGAGLECCNASCGICAPPGTACTTIACEDPCTTNADCGAGDYCQLTEGACSGDGVCVPRPEACDLGLAPVCGCDGVTYGNACEAAAAGAALLHSGQCSTSECAPQDARGEGACDALVGVAWDGARCRELSGCSCVGADCGVYGAGEVERCERDHAACRSCAPQDARGEGACAAILGVAWDGASCATIGGCECIGADCADLYDDEMACAAAYAHCTTGASCETSRDCAAEEYCHLEDGACVAWSGGMGFGECRPRPGELPCSFDAPPVCGCDGTTYGCASDANQSGTSVAYEGVCDEGPCAPMLARGVGPCFADLGVVWDGDACVNIGGCTCEGPDCDAVYASVAECGAARSGCGGTARACSLTAGLPCGEGEWCDYPDTSPCGVPGEMGVCRPRPDVCPPVIDETCGCDGALYTSPCDANAAGWDTFGRPDPSGMCGAPPPG
ncbi:MAG: Kazal-type serine protease inhibitor domain-containing protein [Sandaracinaceae bacterium]